MKTVTATNARSDLYSLIDATVSDHEPIQITGKRGNAVLVGEEDWRAIQETLHLVSIPGMRESILQGMKEPLSKCSREIDL
jgi:prevent-host-death family protein